MALGALAGALASGAASAVGSSLLGGLFGGNKSTTPAFTPPGINAGGLTSSTAGGSTSITSSGERRGLVQGVTDEFGNQADFLGGLRTAVAPGMSALRASRLAEIDNARTAAVGNLRDNMARRRVLGSSFGQDALARTEIEAGQARDKVAAETFLQELELTNALAAQEFEARRSAFETGLNELNLQADIATKLTAGASQQMGANARLEAELNAKSNAGAGKFAGQIMQPFASEIGKGVSSFFKAA